MQKAIYSEAYRDMIQELRQIRERKGLRQEDVGRQLGVTRHWVQKVETCQIRLDVLQLAALCRVYHVDVSSLVRRLVKELP